MVSISQLAVISLLLSTVVVNFSFAQFPMACSDTDSLTNRICCPVAEDGSGICGGDERGSCMSITIPTGPTAPHRRVRDRWPYYFQQVCQCKGNFSGYDCSRCKYGHYGEQCSMKYTGERRPLSMLSDSEWEDYTDIINMTRSYDSGYFVFTEEPQSDDAAQNTSLNNETNVSLYNLYVWVHHYAAKDTSKGKVNST